MKSPVQIFFAIAVLLATATVAAQVYKWVDKDGQVQYTDTPPPPGAAKVEAKKINSAVASTTTVPAGTTFSAKPGDAAKSSKDKAKDAAKEGEKRKADASNAAKKDEETQRNAKANEERCKAATGNLREYESGRPIARTNDNGDRVILGDEERLAEAAKMRVAMTEACK